MRFIERVAAAAALAGLLAGCGHRVPLDTPPATPAAAAATTLPPPVTRKARNWDEYRLQVAYRLVEANRDRIYLEPAPEPLLAIPVLEIELNGDGSVRHIRVARTPTQATDTIDLAIAAVKRAAPFADVSHLPKPWKFSQVFLFDDDRRFKPRELDQ